MVSSLRRARPVAARAAPPAAPHTPVPCPAQADSETRVQNACRDEASNLSGRPCVLGGAGGVVLEPRMLVQHQRGRGLDRGQDVHGGAAAEQLQVRRQVRVHHPGAPHRGRRNRRHRQNGGQGLATRSLSSSTPSRRNCRDFPDTTQFITPQTQCREEDAASVHCEHTFWD